MIIGIIGLGFVGGAIQKAYEDVVYFPDNFVLLDPAKGLNATYKDLAQCTAVFVCVPTPQSDTGECDTSILRNVLKNLADVKYRGVIISKCTAPPNTYKELQEIYPNLVHVPEFLTAANANRDYVNETLLVIGGEVDAYINEAEKTIRAAQKKIEHTKKCTIQEAALMKYARNAFFATKVVFMNEVYELANKLDCNYKVVADMLKADPKMGPSHMKVPGIDDQFGFGGACFPKDTAAMLKFAEEQDVPLNVLYAAVKKNVSLLLKNSK